MNQQKVFTYLLITLAVIGIVIISMRFCNSLQRLTLKQYKKPDVGFGYTLPAGKDK